MKTLLRGLRILWAYIRDPHGGGLTVNERAERDFQRSQHVSQIPGILAAGQRRAGAKKHVLHPAFQDRDGIYDIRQGHFVATNRASTTVERPIGYVRVHEG